MDNKIVKTDRKVRHPLEILSGRTLSDAELRDCLGDKAVEERRALNAMVERALRRLK
jgi:hypothetical protein